jgi:hypothetical protein
VNLAHIVENAGESEAIEIIVSQPKTTAEVDGQVRDPMHMTVQVFDDVFHHLDEIAVGDLSHTTTTGAESRRD